MKWDDGLARAIEVIYDSLDTNEGWMPLLEVVAQDLDAASAHVFLHHNTRGEFIEDCLYGGHPEARAGYQRLAHADPAWHIGQKRPGKLINDVDHFSDAFFESTALYNELMKHYGARYRVTVNLPFSDEMIAGFAVIRSKSMGAFERAHVERLELLVPHMVRILRLQRRMRSLERDLSDVVSALDGLPTAALIVSHQLELMCANRKAEALLEDTTTLRVRRSKLVPERSSEACALRAAVASAIAVAEGAIDARIPPPSVVSISRRAKAPLEVLAVPLRPRYKLRQESGEAARALLLIYDPTTRWRVSPNTLEQLFELTPTEARVAARLAEGESIADIADSRRCSESTVRTHMKRIFRKTDTHRQSELVQVILASPAIAFGR